MRLCELTDYNNRKDFGCQNRRTKVDLVRTCFKDVKWTVASKYIRPTSLCHRKKTAIETTEKVDRQCKGGHGDKKILFPTTWPPYKTESSGDVCTYSSLIVILKMMKERKEGLDESKTCCLYGLTYSKPIDHTWNYSYLWACPPVVRYCFVIDWLINWSNFTLIYIAICIVFFASSLLPLD